MIQLLLRTAVIVAAPADDHAVVVAAAPAPVKGLWITKHNRVPRSTAAVHPKNVFLAFLSDCL